MLTKIKEIIKVSYVFIITVAIAAVYFIGRKGGKDEEKIAAANARDDRVRRVARARGRLGDADFLRRLHDKYRR